MHKNCAAECPCLQVLSAKRCRQSDPGKLLCQHRVCPRKEKPFPDTDGARKHEQRTGHTCLPTECKLCERKLDVTGTFSRRLA